jgi:hypothetical protein
MKLKSILETVLSERYVNVKTTLDKQKYAQEVWDMIQKSYAKIGGYKGVESVDELIKDSDLWKLVRKNNKIVAVTIYKDKYGRKSIVSATDGTDVGKQSLFSIWIEDLKFNRSWAEVSGKAAEIKLKQGYNPIPNKYAADILNKEIVALNPDGFRYTRLISGIPYEKMILGNVKGFKFDI